ncbi:hypothetical protein B484DRAFT_404008, partial [Ochromonadaceae sp. CCMP2298]
FFKSVSTQTVHSLHKPLLDMMIKSESLCTALGGQPFTAALIKRLRATKEAIVLRSLLKMLQLLHEFHLDARAWLTANGLYTLVTELAQSKQVLVRQQAAKLVLDFAATLESVEESGQEEP